MPFSTTGSVISTDLDNMLRGLYRDNSDTTVTGTVALTTLKALTVGANTVGPTGGLHILICGNEAGTAGSKTINLNFGGTIITTITDGAATANNWFFDVWMWNTATNAQRWMIQRRTNDAFTGTIVYKTSAIDTTQNQTLSVSAQLGNTGDSVVESIFDVFVVQPN